MPPENVFTNAVAPIPKLEQLEQRLDALGAHAARHMVEHAVQVHVLVGRQLASRLGSWNTMPKRLAHLDLLRDRVETVERDRAARSGRSSVVSIWIVVVLPAPFGPRNAKISPRLDVERHAVDGLHVAEGLARFCT